MIAHGSIALRALEKKDLPFLQEWRNLKDFRDNFREYRELSLTHQERWYESVQADSSIHHMFGVCDAKTNELIGAAGLCYIHWAYRNADLSFYIGKDRRYADDTNGADTVKALLWYGFQQLNLKRIWCELYETDAMKMQLLTKLGFKKEGTLRCNSFKNGQYIDGHIFAILSEEYFQRK